jgi:PPM family protein phosphatase
MILVEVRSGVGACPEQQDALCVGTEVFQHDGLSSHRPEATDDLLLAIADGVATSKGAARASRLALKYLAEAVQYDPPEAGDGLITGRYLRAIQQRLASKLSKSRSTYGASTTIVVAHLRCDRLAVLNVGDSRCYLRTASGIVRQLSHDHIQLDGLKAEAGYRSDVEYASIYGAVTDCLVADPLEDEFQIHQSTATLSPGDQVVLRSDGIHDLLGDTDTGHWIAESASASEMINGMCAAVAAKGSPDNYSIIAATIGDEAIDKGAHP